MTAIEALKRLYNGNELLAAEYELLRKALTPPTAEEVCEALNTFFNNSKQIFYSKLANSFLWELENGQLTSVVYKGQNIMINYLLPPYLITLIGRFFEAQK